MSSGKDTRFSIKVEPDGEKKVRRDDKPYQKISEHIGVLPIVMVSPQDTCLVSESGEERRRFINSVLSQMDREYMVALQQYNRLLQQRNRLLKDGNAEEGLLDAFDAHMSMLAQPIFSRRESFIRELLPVVREYYALISGGKEQVDIEYRSDLRQGDLASILASCREKDSMFKFTTAGIQRDDFLFGMNGYPIRKCGSQGQQKSFLVALKFAQYEIMKSNYGYAPILLLDDFFDKLDMNRVSNLLTLVAGSDFGQIFLSDSNKVRMSGLVEGITQDSSFFEAAGGAFTKL